jgi:hypothetical protein
MPDLSGFPYFEAQFTRDGQLHDEQEARALLDFLAQQPTTDLFVIAHGWNNDMDEARGFYRGFFAAMGNELNANRAPGLAGRSFAILGVLWPSKRFTEQELIPSGAAGAGSPIGDALLKAQLDDLKGLFDDPAADATLEQAKGLVADLEDSQQARAKFADLIRSLLPRAAADAEDASDRLFTLSGQQLMVRLSRPVFAGRPAPQGGAGGALGGVGGAASGAGGGPGFGQFFTGFRSAARNLLNYTTYYEMKERAGVVGRDGVNPLLGRVRAQQPGIKLHLIGHSFGARLVTAAAGPSGQAPLPIVSLTLLQGAFSHHGFAQRYDGVNDGFFRAVVSDRQVVGPILITYTVNDSAVRTAYPIASLIAGQAASALGDRDDPFGGIGCNGAQKTPEAVEADLLATDGAYQFEAGKLYNLKGDAFIADHGDVVGDEVAHAVFAAVGTT